MVSAAVGAEDFYTVEDHSARFEGLEMARERDRRAIEAWEMHPYVDIVDNRGNFDSKVSKYKWYDHDLFLARSVLECPFFGPLQLQLWRERRVVLSPFNDSPCLRLHRRLETLALCPSGGPRSGYE